MTHDPTRDCEHGRLKSKCDVCDLQAELEATNRQVEILSDALAESRREVAAKDKALDFALEALESIPEEVEGYLPESCTDAVIAIKQARSAPVQEPVAYIRVSKTGHVMACAKSPDFYALPDKTLLYTTPPAQPAPVQEPVAWMRNDGKRVTTAAYRHNYPDYETRYSIPLYTAPPAAQRQWVGLSGEEIDKLKHLIDWTATWSHGRFAYEIEQLLKEKNA